MIYLRPLDLSVDEALSEIMQAVSELGASRVVIDSLSGFEVALAPAFREDFRESLYRLVGALTAAGVTVFMTSEVVIGYPELSFTHDRVSFITDDVISQRYIELDGRLQKVVLVVKMRGGEHSNEFRMYELGPNGAVIGGRLSDYRGIVTGIPVFEPTPGRERAGLTASETQVLGLLIEGGAMTRDDLATRTGLVDAALDLALDRLVTLGYAETPGRDSGRYRAVAL